MIQNSKFKIQKENYENAFQQKSTYQILENKSMLSCVMWPQ